MQCWRFGCSRVDEHTRCPGLHAVEQWHLRLTAPLSFLLGRCRTQLSVPPFCNWGICWPVVGRTPVRLLPRSTVRTGCWIWGSGGGYEWAWLGKQAGPGFEWPASHRSNEVAFLMPQVLWCRPLVLEQAPHAWTGVWF